MVPPRADRPHLPIDGQQIELTLPNAAIIRAAIRKLCDERNQAQRAAERPNRSASTPCAFGRTLSSKKPTAFPSTSSQAAAGRNSSTSPAALSIDGRTPPASSLRRHPGVQLPAQLTQPFRHDCRQQRRCRENLFHSNPVSGVRTLDTARHQCLPQPNGQVNSSQILTAQPHLERRCRGRPHEPPCNWRKTWRPRRSRVNAAALRERRGPRWLQQTRRC